MQNPIHLTLKNIHLNHQLVTSQRSFRRNIISPDMAIALDRTKTSDRNAFMLLASTVDSSYVNKYNYVVLSRSTRQIESSVPRKAIADDIKQSFATDVPLTVHWDGSYDW